MPGQCDMETDYELMADEKWEVDRDSLELGRTLGEGAFGKVLLAKLSRYSPQRHSDPTPLSSAADNPPPYPFSSLQRSKSEECPEKRGAKRKAGRTMTTVSARMRLLSVDSRREGEDAKLAGGESCQMEEMCQRETVAVKMLKEGHTDAVGYIILIHRQIRTFKVILLPL